MILPAGHPLLSYAVVIHDGHTYEDVVAVNDPPNTFTARVKVDVTHLASPGNTREVQDMTVVHPDIFQLTFPRGVPAAVRTQVEAMLAKQHMARHAAAS